MSRYRRKSPLVFLIIIAVLLAMLLGYIRLPNGISKTVKNFASSVAGKENVKSLENYTSKVRYKIDSAFDSLFEVEGQTNVTYSTSPSSYTSDKVSGLEIPAAVQNHQIIDQNYYTISWNSKNKVPDWVAYVITRENLNKNISSRTEDFREDPKVPTTPTLSDYRNSGYDRGHLYSAASAKYGEEAMSSTFLMTNMVPQIHRYNAGVWLKAEDAERDTARMYGKLYAVSGPVLTTGPYEKIGSGVTIPRECYKALLVVDSNGSVYTIAMVIPQENQNGNLKPYLLTVNELEYLTGLDFFPSLSDDIEEIVENSYDLSKWPEVFKK